MTKNRKADSVLSGQFSTKAYKEAARFGDCKVVASSEEQNFSRIPDLDPKEFRPDADYFHICMNNTIYGTVFHALPETGDVPCSGHFLLHFKPPDRCFEIWRFVCERARNARPGR